MCCVVFVTAIALQLHCNDNTLFPSACTARQRHVASRVDFRTYSTVLSWVGVSEIHTESGIYFVFDSRGEILILYGGFDYLRRYRYRNECPYRRISRL